MRYCHPRRVWLLWNGKHWQIDETQKVMQLAMETATSIWEEVAAATDESIRNELVRHAKRSGSQAMLKAMVASAKTEQDIAISPDELDQAPWLLNCQNGTLDLKTGELQRHSRKDLLTKLSPVVYAPEAACPLWLQFLGKVMDGNADMVSFLQRAAGYSLTGITNEQCLFLLWGTGKNGKTTFLEVLKALMGPDYAKPTSSQTFMEKKGAEISNALAALNGMRIVTAPDLDKNQHLSEALIKQVTGEDEISARFLYGEYFSYKPQFKLWMMANHQPPIRGVDVGIWRRMLKVNFQVQISEADRDRQLMDQLKAELPGILNWALAGLLSLAAGGPAAAPGGAEGHS
jgi:putative DNA primase/helicase